MNLRRFVSNVEKQIADNSPVILTAFGVAGVATTAYLTGKATIKAQRILDREIQPDRTFKTDFELVWKLYIPPVLSGVLTCGAIIFANRIGTRRAAAMASAFAISERAFDEYKEKVVDQIGKNKAQKIHDEVMQDRVTKNPPNEGNIIVSGGEVLCKDAWSGRYFMADMETIKQAQNAINYQVNNHGNASLTDFYNWLGLEPTKESDNVGWNGDKLMEVMFTSAIADNQKPVLVMDFKVAPIRDFWRVH